MKKIIAFVLIVTMCLPLVACNNTEEIKNLQIQIEQLNAKTENQTDIQALLDQIKELNSQIEQQKSIISDANDKISELAKQVSESETPKVTKEDIIGTWYNVFWGDLHEFTEDNFDIIDNFLIVDVEDQLGYPFTLYNGDTLILGEGGTLKRITTDTPSENKPTENEPAENEPTENEPTGNVPSEKEPIISEPENDTNAELENTYQRILNHLLEHSSSIYTEDGERLTDGAAKEFAYNWLSEHREYKDSVEYLSKFIVIPNALSYTTKIVTDAFGQKTETVGHYYYYDDNGECYELSELKALFDTLGIYTGDFITTICEYDENGVLIGASFLRYDNSSETKLITTKVSFTYDDQGHIIKADCITRDGFTWTNTYTYDQAGHLIRSDILYQCNTDFHSYYDHGWVDEYLYDANGKKIQRNHISNQDRYFSYLEKYAYDDNGNLTEKTHFKYVYPGVPATTPYITYSYSYNEQGNISYVNVTDDDSSYIIAYNYEDFYIYNSNSGT